MREIQYLITLKAVVKTGSFTAAGNELGYTQSAVTNQMRQLENAFGIKLLIGSEIEWSFTQAGNELLLYANEMLNIIDRMKLINHATENLHGTLRIAIRPILH